MQIKLPFDGTKPVTGEASIEIDKPVNDVFTFIGEGFFENYPKWAVEVIEFEPLTGDKVFTGAKAKQVREEAGERVESIFEITEYEPLIKLILQGVASPYKHLYLLQSSETQAALTQLTFRFELLELEIFMRPFEKLIRLAIEEGAENTVANIKNLIAVQN
ncbi:MAG: SRPBCC family protein [Methylococcaceae bacterium]|jgi:hypothetical protein